MENFLDGIGRELRSSAPSKTRLALTAFQARLKADRIAGGQKRFEQELEAFINKHSALRGAAKRHLRSSMVPAVDAAIAALNKATKVLKELRRAK